ncbi:MAG: phosphoribosyltransferase family protein [Kofleriaceae bacterium]
MPAWNRDPDPFVELISADQIATRTAELGAQITADYRALAATADVVLLGVLKGSILFMADLARHVALPIYLDFIGISSYGDATESSGVVRITHDLSRPIAGKHVIIVEDIVDTGHTVHYLMENLATRKPASIKLCSLPAQAGAGRARDHHRLPGLHDPQQVRGRLRPRRGAAVSQPAVHRVRRPAVSGDGRDGGGSRR